MPSPYVTRDLFRFLGELRRHNNREWFNANKDRYLAEMRDPLLGFIAAIAPGLRAISPHLVADPHPSRGSLLRIYRDTRFSRDKTPYKTNAGLFFALEAEKDAEAPGYYLHLAPGEVFMGAGMWRPGGETLQAIRSAIVRDPSAWKRARRPGLTHAPELHDRRQLHRGAGLRRRLPGALRPCLPPRGAADEVPRAGDARGVLIRPRSCPPSGVALAP